MNSLSYYHLREEPWTDIEDLQLRTEYVDQELDIIQIADLHYKTPGQISHRLKKLSITEHYYKGTRGYNTYSSSALHQEIKDSPKAHIKKEKKERKGRKTKSQLVEDDIQLQQEQKDNQEEIHIEVSQLREEIKGIKKDVKEILRMITAVYDFEAQL
jgi:hypothetical protein